MLKELADKLVQLNPPHYVRTVGGLEFGHYFPVCNEAGWLQTYENIEGKIAQYRIQKGVAIVFGESHFLSLLPLFVKMGIELLVLADIEPRLHASNLALRECFERSPHLNLFKENWLRSSRLPQEDIERVMRSFHRNLDTNNVYLGKYHFLANEQRYQICKAALSTISLCQIDYDVFCKHSSALIADTIKEAGAQLALVNLTNISSYDPAYEMRDSLPQLFKYTQPLPIILYSTSTQGLGLRLFSHQTGNYGELKKHMDSLHRLDFMEVNVGLANSIGHFVFKILSYKLGKELTFLPRNDWNYFLLKFSAITPPQVFSAERLMEYLNLVFDPAMMDAQAIRDKEDFEEKIYIYHHFEEFSGYNLRKFQLAKCILRVISPVPTVQRSLIFTTVYDLRAAQEAAPGIKQSISADF